MAAIASSLMSAFDRLMLRGLKVAYAMLALCAVMFFWQAFANRSPPFMILSVDPATGRPGDYIRIYASVWRDPMRRCSTEYSRYLFDRDGMRYDLGNSSLSSDAIAHLERITPGRMAVAVQLPAGLLPGRAKIQTALSYACNPAQKWLPIDVLTELPFNVLPPP